MVQRGKASSTILRGQLDFTMVANAEENSSQYLLLMQDAEIQFVNL